jgi:hypothetical protein
VFNCSALGSNPGAHYRWSLFDKEREETSIIQVYTDLIKSEIGYPKYVIFVLPI